jgi:hypothetical protein
VEENSLTVSTPESLKGTYQSAIGNFGVPQYGGTLSGFVVYPKVNAKACERFPNEYFRSQGGARPNFALVERGGNNTPQPDLIQRPSNLVTAFALLLIPPNDHMISRSESFMISARSWNPMNGLDVGELGCCTFGED